MNVIQSSGVSALVLSLLTTTTPFAADLSTKSSPPDTKVYQRPATPGDQGVNRGNQGRVTVGHAPQIEVIDVILNNTSPVLGTGPSSETSIAINPRNHKEIALTAFEFNLAWGTDSATLFHSLDGGQTWTEPRIINRPPNGLGIDGCPCDQTIDFSRSGLLTGAFLSTEAIYTSSTADAEAGPFNWFESPIGTAQPTNTTHPSPDQPWMLVNAAPLDPGTQVAGLDEAGWAKRKRGENVYVAYDDFSTFPPTMRVAVAAEGASPDFTTDTSDGVSSGFVNPGHRLAKDEKTGTVYSLFQQATGLGPDSSVNINYRLNRSTDGGKTWTLNGSAGGIVVANADSTQPQPKFCTVNALLGGVDHGTVASDGSVYYVYGSRDPATANNRLAIRHLTDDGSGGFSIGAEYFITGQVQAAVPQVAVGEDGTVGVFYYTCDDDGVASSSFPQYSAHFALSDDEGVTWSDIVLQTFLSPAKDDGDPRQRVLADYMQTKTLLKGETFYGSFSGNAAALGAPVSRIDPMFFRVTASK
jgi:hypothetical protein